MLVYNGFEFYMDNTDTYTSEYIDEYVKKDLSERQEANYGYKDGFADIIGMSINQRFIDEREEYKLEHILYETDVEDYFRYFHIDYDTMEYGDDSMPTLCTITIKIDIDSLMGR
ncbi:MAG: hypothetical protein VZS44_08065 [Bacilli bacterium]|nr:hypothetical protein [Bacilli bacterium]